MAKPVEIVDLNNFNNLSQDELKRKVLDWVRDNGISEKLHSQLRCDLIASFNKTHLGRYIESQFQSEYRMILSPVILSLNTLVAEFLYAQNCHYSLSVFSTEVPFKNTIPEFEKRDQFRFTKSELNEIFQALGIESKQVCDNISTTYYKNHNKGNNSLLFFIFHNIFNKTTCKNTAKLDGSDKLQEEPVDEITSEMCSNCRTINLSQNKSLPVNKRDLKYINKYLYISVKKIYKLAKEIDKLELTNSKDRLRRVAKIENENSPIVEQNEGLANLLVLNKSLEKLTNEFKTLMNVEKLNKDSVDYNFMMLINDVIRITTSLNDKFETCNHNVALLLKYFTEGSKNDAVAEKEEGDKYENFKESKLCYKEWLENIKESKHGKKFLKKLEANFVKTLLKEKQQHAKDFQERLEKEKSVIKLHYRQKYIEHLTKRTEQNHESETQINALQGFIVQNTKFIEHSDRVLQELNKKSGIHDNINIETGQNERNFGKQTVCLSQHPVFNISIEPMKFDEVTQTVVPSIQLDDPVEDLVLDAKKRISDLDKESEQLDQYFQSYLQRQISEKSKYKIDISKIWHKYNSGRLVLNSKNYNLINNKACGFVLPETSDIIRGLNLNDITDETSNYGINKIKDQLEDSKTKNFTFKNTQQETDNEHINKPKLVQKNTDPSIINNNSIKNPFENLPIEDKSTEKDEISQPIEILTGTINSNHKNII